MREKVQNLLIGIGLGIFLGVTFFQHILGLVVCIPMTFVYVWYARIRTKQKKKNQLEIQFKDAVLAMVSSMQAGYSLNHAFRDAMEISCTVYGESSMIVKLLERIVWGQTLNIPMDDLLEEMAIRSELEAVKNFTDVIRVTRRYGGNLPEMMNQLVNVIEDRLTVNAEILSVTASVRYEAYFMDIIPVGIIWYLNLTAAEFLSALYDTVAGRCFMVICLLVYLGVVAWQFYIMESEIG